MEGRDLSAKHLLHWLKVDSKKNRTRLYRATTISNVFPGGPPVNRPHDNPTWRVPFHHSANLFNMPQAGMFRKEDGTLRVPKSNCTLDGTPLKPEGDPEDMLDPHLLTTPWSENETQLMFQLFPRIDSLCLNFGRTGVFQWNDADSSTLRTPFHKSELSGKPCMKTTKPWIRVRKKSRRLQEGGRGGKYP